MKANAPKKIYLQVCGGCEINDCDNCFFEDLEDNVTWCKDRIFPRDIEYTRTDAFIEKACEFLKSYRQDTSDGIAYIAGIVNDKTIEDFRKYMKGE